jgi:molybdopterin converting factor small subunit
VEVIVKLYSELRGYAPDDRTVFPIQLPNDASVGDVMRRLGIPPAVPRTVLINGRRVDDLAPLSAGDEIVLMPPIEGG